jgi:lycopene cyclase domain-containing protein
MRTLYLIIDLSSWIVPFIFSFHPRIKFYKHFRAVVPALLIPAFGFLIWDALFTAKGIWCFNPQYLIGMYFLNLPLEEILFFICIPYACLFTYYCLNLFYNFNWATYTTRMASVLISTVLLAFAFFHINKAYTASTFISTAIVLVIFTFIFRITWMGKLLSIYPVLLIPFFIVNGILTGTGLQEPVVWYNNSENIGIRLLTIPIEDVIYGFELILLNVFFFEKFSSPPSFTVY